MKTTEEMIDDKKKLTLYYLHILNTNIWTQFPISPFPNICRKNTCDKKVPTPKHDFAIKLMKAFAY